MREINITHDIKRRSTWSRIRLCVLCILCVLCAGNVRAQLTTLDWEELRIDTLLPVYSEVVPLETDYREYDYKVCVEYPEWGTLTAREIKQLERIGAGSIGETLDVHSSVGVSRKRGALDISFVPIVRVGKEYRKLLSGKIVITAVPKKQARNVRRVTTPAERYATNSVLAQGRWVKIAVTNDGMYRLTRSALTAMGFNNPDNVRLYGHGGHRLSEVSNPDAEYDDLQEVPLYKADANTWLFWGNGLLYWNGNTRIFNPYATQAYYFLTEGTQPSAITTETAQVEASVVYSTFTDHSLYEHDEYAWYHGGRNLFDGENYATRNSHTYKLQTHDSQGEEKLTVTFTASADVQTQLTPVVNGNSMPVMTMSAIAQYISATSSTRTSDVSAYADGSEWTIKLTTTKGNDARLDYLALHYKRLITPNEGYVAFTGAAAGPARFDVTGTGLQVMRIGEPGSPACLVAGSQQTDGHYWVDVEDASRRYVAFNPSHAFPEPTVVGEVSNQNLHAMGPTDMVIIVPSSGKLTAEAERLAEAHRQYDGLRVQVVSADRIYNEFSSGTPDATAYRRLMKMLYDRATTEEDMPRYLLLFGDCAWDNRMISTSWKQYSPADYLLCFESENSFSDTQSYVMEDYFGLLDDGEGSKLTDDKTDLGVGRFPVTSANEAKAMVDKSIDFLTNSNAGNWKNVISVLGDDGDNNEHLEMADDVAERIIKDYPSMEVRKVMWDAFRRVSTLSGNTFPEVKQIIDKQLEDGVLVMNYTGHGATYTMSHERVLNLADFASYTSRQMPLWVAAACDVMPFDGQVSNIGETAVLNPSGAAVAFYSTARTVYASNNLHMNRWFMYHLLGTDEKGQRYRIGDAIRLSKNYLITGKLETFHKENKLHYALLGDPALTFGAPRQRVVLDSINGVYLPEASAVQLKSGEKVHMSGHIETVQGDSITDFFGVLTARIYDNLETVTCLNNAGVKKGAFTFSNREKMLYNGQDSVRGGRFNIDYVMPIDINFSNESGRVVFYAINNDRSVEANGYNESFTIGGISDTADSDKQGPHIYAYLNTEDFQNGDRVNAAPYFVAQLEDENGINYGGSGLGHDLLLTIDDNVATTYTLNESYTPEFGDYTRGSVAFCVPTLSNGAHTLTFRAWDVLNNSSVTTLSFVVDDSLKPSLLRVGASQNPAISSTNFIIQHGFPGADCQLLIEVFDFSGRCMWSHSAVTNSTTGVITVPWNLTTGIGGRLDAGIYLYRATLSCGTSKKVSKTQKLIVHGNK